jgi:hypothetical protein
MANGKIGKAKKYFTDIAMFPIMIITAVSGLAMHITHEGRGIDHSASEISLSQWRDIHLISAFVWLILMCIHVNQHWLWYKNIITNLNFKNNKLSLIISILAFLLVFSGILLFTELFPFPAKHVIGELHDKFGEILVILLTFHIVQRFKWIIKTTKELFSALSDNVSIAIYYLKKNSNKPE